MPPLCRRFMAPPRGLSTPRALKVIKIIQNKCWSQIIVFLTALHHILHARNYYHFLSSPHTPKPPRPLKRPPNFNLLLHLFNFDFLGLLLRAYLGYGYTSHAGAIHLLCWHPNHCTNRALVSRVPWRIGFKTREHLRSRNLDR